MLCRGCCQQYRACSVNPEQNVAFNCPSTGQKLFEAIRQTTEDVVYRGNWGTISVLQGPGVRNVFLNSPVNIVQDCSNVNGIRNCGRNPTEGTVVPSTLAQQFPQGRNDLGTDTASVNDLNVSDITLHGPQDMSNIPIANLRMEAPSPAAAQSANLNELNDGLEMKQVFNHDSPWCRAIFHPPQEFTPPFSPQFPAPAPAPAQIVEMTPEYTQLELSQMAPQMASLHHQLLEMAPTPPPYQQQAPSHFVSDSSQSDLPFEELTPLPAPAPKKKGRPLGSQDKEKRNPKGQGLKKLPVFKTSGRPSKKQLRAREEWMELFAKIEARGASGMASEEETARLAELQRVGKMRV